MIPPACKPLFHHTSRRPAGTARLVCYAMFPMRGTMRVLGGGTLAILIAWPAGAEGLSPGAPSPAVESAVAPLRDPPSDPAVTPRTLTATVCVPGYTRRVRASSRWLRALKRERLAAIGLGPEHARGYQLDHRLPLILGGAADDAANLELQPLAEAQRKDRIERKLGCFVCNGQMSLDEARLWITGDWREAYHAWAPVKCRRPGRRA